MLSSSPTSCLVHLTYRMARSARALNARYDWPMRSEESRKMLTVFTLFFVRSSTNDDHYAVKELVECIEMLAPIPAPRKLYSEENTPMLLQAVSAQRCYLQSESALSYQYDFAAATDPLHASIRRVQTHLYSTTKASTPSDSLHNQQERGSQGMPANARTYDEYQKRFGRSP